MSRNTRTIRAHPDDSAKLLELSRELSNIQQQDIKTAEVIRRALNVPNLKEILKADAELKRRLGR